MGWKMSFVGEMRFWKRRVGERYEIHGLIELKRIRTIGKTLGYDGALQDQMWKAYWKKPKNSKRYIPMKVSPERPIRKKQK